MRVKMVMGTKYLCSYGHLPDGHGYGREPVPTGMGAGTELYPIGNGESSSLVLMN